MYFTIYEKMFLNIHGILPHLITSSKFKALVLVFLLIADYVQNIFFKIYLETWYYFWSNCLFFILTTAKSLIYTQFNYSDVYYVLHNEIWTLIFSSYMLSAGCNYSHRYLFIWWILLLLHSLINMEISQNLLYIQ